MFTVGETEDISPMTITVNGTRANWNKGKWAGVIDVHENVSDSLQQVDVTAVYNPDELGVSDRISNKSRKILLPQRQSHLEYDLDGNLLRDGVWDYVWNGENRLVRMTRPSSHPLGQLTVQFTYDYLGRRTSKNVFSAGTAIEYTAFLYDGWNLIAEIDLLDNNSTKRTYVWGNDLSGSRQGAGGVGGLLAMTDHTVDKSYFYIYDHIGNVTGLFDADIGDLVQEYDYGPFGEMISTNGDVKQPFRFSTKYTDSETDLVYYGFRYYNSELGRFLNRDPIAERGGYNLYGFVNNDPINKIDVLGKHPLLYASAAAALAAARAAIKKLIDTIKCIRCKKPELHPAHHYFTVPIFIDKFPYMKLVKAWMKHVQVNCWLKGKKGSKWDLQFPYGPKYKNPKGNPPGTW